MPKAAYTLKKKKDTEESHLFKGIFKDQGCTSELQSICKKMKKNESISNTFVCYDEDQARLKCAEQGREVCGICVSHLYATY